MLIVQLRLMRTLAEQRLGGFALLCKIKILSWALPSTSMSSLRIGANIRHIHTCLCINEHRRPFVPTEAEPDGGYPSPLGYSDPDEQRHTHAGARWGVWLRVSGRERLHKLLLLLWGLSLRGVASRAPAHPRLQDRLVRTHLLPYCLRPLQPRLLGVIPVPVSATAMSAAQC